MPKKRPGPTMRKKAPQASAKPYRNSGRQTEADEIWASFKAELKGKILFLRELPEDQLKNLCPFDKPESVLKRSVYEFIKKYEATQLSARIFAAIEDDDDASRQLKINSSTNPFYGALSRLSIGDEKMTAGKVSRYAGQLLYAHRHEVPPEFLVGFLYQTGNPDITLEKSKDQSIHEDWYKSKKAT